MRHVSPVHATRSSVAALGGGSDVLDLVDATTGQPHTLRSAHSDIDTSVRFSLWRCIVSVVGFALVLTDIPRTGLSLSLADYYHSVSPGVYASYGPFAYPSIHINHTITTNGYQGSRRGLAVSAANVWAYKFDTLSIAQRAVAQHLQVASYPDCILYRAPCPALTLSLATAFAMIDGWISAVQMRYFDTSSMDRDLPFTFMTRSNWLDRLHHVLLKIVWRRQDSRLHTVRFHAWDAINSTSHPWTVCNPPTVPRHRRVRRAYICDLYFQWRFTHPFPPLPAPAPPPPKVTIPTHIQLRMAAFKRQYPNLELDLTILTTRSILASEPVYRAVPMVFYSTENVEITTWIRGRRCLKSSLQCETVFIDDYRYEGATLISNAEDWRLVTGILRGTAQAYIWVRFLCLCVGTYLARSSEFKYRHRSGLIRLVATAMTLSKIPSHVVVYGSWLPVVCYSTAHVIDSGLTHLVSNNLWASMDGLFQFQFISYVRSASVQMRNVWMVALMWKTVLCLLTYMETRSTGVAWRPRNGVVAIRGIAISFVSWITIFSFLRALRFRDTNIIAFTELPRHVPYNGLRSPPNYSNIADFGYRLDVKTAVTALLLVTVYAQVMQRLVWHATTKKTRFFFCRTFYIPHSAERLWSHSMLHLFWNLSLTKSTHASTPPASTVSPSSVVASAHWRFATRVIEKTILPPVLNRHLQCVVCNRVESLLHWKRVQGCGRHDHLFRVDKRSPEVWAMVRLLNIVLLSDPIALVQVYLFGRELVVYASKPKGDTTTTPTSDQGDSPRLGFLLPATLPDVGEANPATMGQLELFTVINSKTVPWGVLVNCG